MNQAEASCSAWWARRSSFAHPTIAWVTLLITSASLYPLQRESPAIMRKPNQKSIFRKTALDRLSSPEQLDKLVTIADSKGWLALLSIAIALLCVLAWGWFGSIPSQVNGEGILIARGGQLADAMAASTGTLTKLNVALNDSVSKGDIIAHIKQTATEQQLTNLQELVEENKTEIKHLQASHQQEAALKKTNSGKRRAALNKSIQAARQQVKFLRRTLVLQKKSAKQGYVTQQKVNETTTRLNTVLQNISNLQFEILNLEAADIDLASTQEQRVSDQRQQLNNNQRRIRELRSQLAGSSVVRAPVAGRVTEVKQTEGNIVQAGQAVLSIETEGDGLQALLYIPTQHGKKVLPGMQVRIELVTVKKEEFGSLLGVVRSVSNFPISPQGMAAVLRNEALAASFSKKGSPYAMRVDLFADETLASGYRWTSLQGPPLQISSGTTLKAQITVREQRPLSLVLPLLKKASGIYWQ